MTGIFTLIPERVQYEQFWIDIKNRNKWLIHLRYGAFFMLLGLIAIFYIFDYFFPAFHINIIPIWLVSLIILTYNLIFDKLWDKLPANYDSQRRFHSLHFSLLQIVFDFISLMLLVYFTGGIESPIYAFFLFHVIIGSLLMPIAIINLIITLTLMITFSGAILEFKRIIPHYAVSGIIDFPLFDNLPYLIIFFTFFSLTLYISNYLANSIAKRLYEREKDLTRAYQELDNAEKTKSKYVMTVVHDLKTPIAAATTYLNMILDGMLGEINPEQLRPLERSKSRLDNAINTINDILHISQLKLSSDPTEVEIIDLKSLFEEFYTEMSVLFNAKKIQFSLEMVGEDVKIEAEPKILKYALANLVSNAHKYTEDNGKVVITLKDNKESVIISVADNGIGIPDKEKEKIFKDFYRSTISKQKGIEGTGLGMSVLVNTLQKYHGSLQVNSPSYLAEEGKPGSEFIVTIPKKYSII